MINYYCVDFSRAIFFSLPNQRTVGKHMILITLAKLISHQQQIFVKTRIWRSFLCRIRILSSFQVSFTH